MTLSDALLHGGIEDISPAFTNFLTFLGEKIELKGWKGYRAGLDVAPSQNTGTHSIYTKWQGYEIMFHTSHLLPYLERSTEQVRLHLFFDFYHYILGQRSGVLC